MLLPKSYVFFVDFWCIIGANKTVAIFKIIRQLAVKWADKSDYVLLLAFTYVNCVTDDNGVCRVCLYIVCFAVLYNTLDWTTELQLFMYI